MEGKSIKSLREVTGKEIMDYYKYLKDRPNSRGEGVLSESMQYNHMWALRVLFKYLQEKGEVDTDPMSVLKIPKTKKKQRAVLTKGEIEKLYKASETKKDRALLGLFYGCGLRKSEVEALNVKDISFKSRLVYVRSGKGKRRRGVPVPKGVMEDLKSYYYQERIYVVHKQAKVSVDAQRAFLLNAVGTRLKGQSLWRRLRVLVLKSGINNPERVTLHCLRHTIATHLLQKGVPIEQVRDFLGHTNLESTQGYTRVNTGFFTENPLDRY